MSLRRQVDSRSRLPRPLRQRLCSDDENHRSSRDDAVQALRFLLPILSNGYRGHIDDHLLGTRDKWSSPRARVLCGGSDRHDRSRCCAASSNTGQTADRKCYLKGDRDAGQRASTPSITLARAISINLMRCARRRTRTENTNPSGGPVIFTTALVYDGERSGGCRCATGTREGLGVIALRRRAADVVVLIEDAVSAAIERLTASSRVCSCSGGDRFEHRPFVSTTIGAAAASMRPPRSLTKFISRRSACRAIHGRRVSGHCPGLSQPRSRRWDRWRKDFATTIGDLPRTFGMPC